MKPLIPLSRRDGDTLPAITFRQLESFRVVCREGSFTNAALELRTTRASVKRICADLQKAVGRPLLHEDPAKNVQPTEFGRGSLSQMGPLSHAIRQLGACVRSLHEGGRVLRLAAAGELFQGGLFSAFLSRLRINEGFRPCFLRFDVSRFRSALLNAECDVYFGVALCDCDRLDLIDLGAVEWQIDSALPRGVGTIHGPVQLRPGKWCVESTGEAAPAAAILEKFHAAGAAGGVVVPAGSQEDSLPPLRFRPDVTARELVAVDSPWPHYRYFAALRKHHPYSELKNRLERAARS